jgi:16S rRNA (adenine1518-N6/adenine1519-N6)-dimethyltransferase
MRLNKKLGQHFLSDFSYLARESQLFNCKDKIVLEIGGGDGRLSKHIFRDCSKLYIVEKDPRFIEHLSLYFSSFENVVVLGDNFLEIEPFNVDLIVGNVPYYISSEIVFKLLDWPANSAFLMFQKEFGLKLIAEGKQKSRLSFFAQYYFDLKKHFIVPKKAFTPAPKVDSILIEFKRKNVKKLSDEVHSLISFFFQHKPKTLRASLKLYSKLNDKKIDLSKTELIQYLDKRIYELTLNETFDFIEKIIK